VRLPEAMAKINSPEDVDATFKQADTCNIILIGNSGSGKSSLLASFNDFAQLELKVQAKASINRVTTDIERVTVVMDNGPRVITTNIFDTVGTDDPEWGADRVFDMFKKLNLTSINAVILFVDGTRFKGTQKRSLQDFMKRLEIQKHTVYIFITHVTHLPQNRKVQVIREFRDDPVMSIFIRPDASNIAVTSMIPKSELSLETQNAWAEDIRQSYTILKMIIRESKDFNPLELQTRCLLQ
jgi:signal recognition particle receptor subunit beta